MVKGLFLDIASIAILAKAFKGELVEQLPSDGDAKDLLEQIQKAKAELEKTGKTKPRRGKTRKMKKDEDGKLAAEPRGGMGKIIKPSYNER